MFITLLLVTLVIALATSLLVMRLFDKMIRKILDRLVSAELSAAWNRYLSFAVVVVGVSGGVRVWSLEKYINGAHGRGPTHRAERRPLDTGGVPHPHRHAAERCLDSAGVLRLLPHRLRHHAGLRIAAAGQAAPQRAGELTGGCGALY